MTINDRYLVHKEKLEMFSAAEIMKALNDFFSDPNWRNEKRLVIRSEFSTGVKCANMAADWAIDSAIRYLREEFGIFYAPDVVNKDDEYRKQDIKCTNDLYKHELDEIYKTEFDHHSVKAIIVALNRWFGNEGRLPVKYFDTFIGYSDFCIDEPYVDNGAHLDGCPSHYYNASTWDSNANCPNRPKNAAYAAIEYLREEHGIFYSPQMEPDNSHKTKDELKESVRADYWFRTARERLEAIESYISELKTHNEALRKDASKWLSKYNDLRNRCNSVFGAGGFVTKAMVNDLCDEYNIVRPGDDEDCKASLRYILDILKEYRDKYDNLCDRARGAGQAYKLICDICDKYEIKKPSSDLMLEESIDDILKRFKMTLKENQDFRYEAERLYCNMTGLQPGPRMTILGILRAIAEDVDDREAEYSYMEEKCSVSEKLRKDWVRRYESEHERANGEKKRADKYWAQVAGLQTRIKNLEDALNRSASNATGYEALKNTLRRTLDSEVRLKSERDSLAEELKRAKDAIRKQNEAILRKERLDEPSDNCDSEE